MHRTGALAFVRSLQKSRSVILAYHGVLTSSDESRAYLDDNFPTAEAFERQIQHLTRYYNPIPLRQLISHYETGERLPPSSVAVTFDDGFANNYTVAFPILQKYGVPFTVFLTTAMIGQPGARLWTEQVSRALYLTPRKRIDLAIGTGDVTFRLATPGDREASSRALLSVLKRTRPQERTAIVARVLEACDEPPLDARELERYDFLTWEQARAMAASGVEFGSHTVSHPILSTLDRADLVRELVQSKADIETQLGSPCEAFAYPNGSFADFGDRDKEMLREVGYRCALANNGSLNGSKIDLFALQRVNIGRQFDAPLFQAMVCGITDAAARVRTLMTLGTAE
jgi:peptidoglycan/xylan/chitin deacetylase (PgdA/CDA1 family)